jgi:hypothetical protein
MYWLWFKLLLKSDEFHWRLNLREKHMNPTGWNKLFQLRDLAHQFDMNKGWK